MNAQKTSVSSQQVVGFIRYDTTMTTVDFHERSTYSTETYGVSSMNLKQ